MSFFFSAQQLYRVGEQRMMTVVHRVHQPWDAFSGAPLNFPPGPAVWWSEPLADAESYAIPAFLDVSAVDDRALPGLTAWVHTVICGTTRSTRMASPISVITGDRAVRFHVDESATANWHPLLVALLDQIVAAGQHIGVQV